MKWAAVVWLNAVVYYNIYGFFCDLYVLTDPCGFLILSMHYLSMQYVWNHQDGQQKRLSWSSRARTRVKRVK